MHREADHALPIGAQATGPGPDERARQNTPVWMEVSGSPPALRRGASPTRTSGTSAIVFFGLITLAVGAAGFAGVALWGPEKPIKNRTQLASNPPPPITLPSLPATASPAATEAATAPLPATAPPSATAPPGEQAAPAKTKATRTPTRRTR